MRPSVVRLIVLLTVIGAATISVRGSTPPPSPPNEGQQIGKILSVRKVLENRYVGSRYPQIHYYLLYFAVRTSDRTYCAEYETPGVCATAARKATSTRRGTLLRDQNSSNIEAPVANGENWSLHYSS